MSKISVNIKPISVAKHVKKDYTYNDIDPTSYVTEFCQFLVMELQIAMQFDCDDLQLMCLGKTLDHFKTF
jgi:hypothetical protein